jgi:hypothetical protein
MLKPVYLDYNFDIFLKADYTQRTEYSVNIQRARHKGVNVFPETYVEENTMVKQIWWDNTQIDFEYLGQVLGIDVKVVSSIKQEPGCILPVHTDEFYQMGLKNPGRTETKVRANIFLEDWKSGHYLEYNNTPAVNWQAGQGFMWDSSVPHLSANAGLEPKYTLQVSGFLKD